MPERGQLFRRGGAEVPDEPAALEAAGLCGAENRRKPGGPESETSDRPAKFRYCHRAPLKGKRRCKRHNGDAPAGPAAPGWGLTPAGPGQARDQVSRSAPGRYSKILGGSYAEAYQSSLAEAEAGKGDLREQIALLDARERRLVELAEARRLERGESGEAWRRARALYQAARKASAAGEAAAFSNALDELGAVIKAGAGEEDVWREIRDNALARRRLADTQQKLSGQAGDYLGRPELRMIAAHLVQLFRDVLPERDRLAVAVKRVDEIMEEAARVPHDVN